jgi:hypothetical protein
MKAKPWGTDLFDRATLGHRVGTICHNAMKTTFFIMPA